MSIKKYIIKVLIILIILTINMMFVQKSYVSATDFMAEGKKFLTQGGDEYEVINKDALQGTSNSVFKVLLSIAICASVIVGAVLGIQFILGSVEGKAKVSEALVPYIVGCVIVFGSFTIWKIAVNIGNNAEDSIESETYQSTTYTEENGKLYCDNCKRELSIRDQRNGKCHNCNHVIQGI